MALPVPPLQDVVRLTGTDVETTAANFRKHLRSTGPVWGYDPSKRLARAVFSLDMPREAAVASCGQRGHPSGRPQNAEVGGLIWDAAAARGKFLCHSLPPRLLSLRSDIAIKVDPQFFFIQNGRPVLFYLQPRKGVVPGVDGLRVIASAIHSLFAIDDLSEADLLLLDLSMPLGCDTRAVAPYSFADLPPLPTAQTEAFFQRFVDAYDLVSAEGMERTARRPRPDEGLSGDLFGGPLAE